MAKTIGKELNFQAYYYSNTVYCIYTVLYIFEMSINFGINFPNLIYLNMET